MAPVEVPPTEIPLTGTAISTEIPLAETVVAELVTTGDAPTEAVLGEVTSTEVATLRPQFLKVIIAIFRLAIIFQISSLTSIILQRHPRQVLQVLGCLMRRQLFLRYWIMWGWITHIIV